MASLGAVQPGATRRSPPSNSGEHRVVSRILHDLEGGELISFFDRSLPSKNDLQRIQSRAFQDFAPPVVAAKGGAGSGGASLGRSSSSPSGLGGAGGGEMVDGTSSVGTRPRGHSSAVGVGHVAATGHSGSPGWRGGPFGPRPMLQRDFTISNRPPIYRKADNELGPGTYDTQDVGAYIFERDHDVSHPAQRSLSNHKSPPLASFGKPKVQSNPSKSPLGQLPGPGHYMKPDLWDPNWQKFPTSGKSFVRHVPVPAESRFGGLAQGLGHGGGKGGEMDLLG